MPWSQLHWCAFRNDARGIDRLLTPGGFCCRRLPSPDVRDKVGATPLHVAAAHGQCHAVEALIRSGASASAQTDVYNSTKQGGQRGGETPLHWIVQLRYNPEDLMYVRREQELHSGHIMAARKLLGRDKGGADVNAQSGSTGRTALHDAVENGFDDMTKLLMYEFHADINLADNAGVTPKNMAEKLAARPQGGALLQLMTEYEESLEKQAGFRPGPATPAASPAPAPAVPGNRPGGQAGSAAGRQAQAGSAAVTGFKAPTRERSAPRTPPQLPAGGGGTPRRSPQRSQARQASAAETAPEDINIENLGETRAQP